MKIVSLNVNGIRSAEKKGLFSWMLSNKDIDIFCFQEVRANVEQLSDIFFPKEFYYFYHSADRKGYSGVAIYSRKKPDNIFFGIKNKDIDCEGRVLYIIFKNIIIVSLYMPSGTSSCKRQIFKYYMMNVVQDFLEENKKNNVIICGDFNIVHKKNDIARWDNNQNTSGCLLEERKWIDKILNIGYIDAFRIFNKNDNEYTWWSNMHNAWEKNIGWRIDYQIISKRMIQYISYAKIFKEKRFSDHAPVIIEYKM